MKVMCVFGTRPEAIKMSPVVHALRARRGIDCQVCLTGQHREMLDQVLNIFCIRPDYNLGVMARARTLAELTAAMVTGLDHILQTEQPDRVLVHGDTTTTLSAGLAAYYRRIPVAHVEAGLRTNDLYAPWPEEGNRQIVGRIADIHFAPTARARDHLLAEAVPPHAIHVTGNTVIDALNWVTDEVLTDPRIDAGIGSRFGFLTGGRRVILVTGHRRESHDGGLSAVFRAIRTLTGEYDLDVVYPVHPNPIVQSAAREVFDNVRGVHLIQPLDYLSLIWLMRRSYFVITDSGGIQEEAPSLSKPVLVTREKTERPEAVAAGVVRLVGTDEGRILAEARRLLDHQAAYDAMARRQNPYGDGHAAERIAAIISGTVRPGMAAPPLRTAAA